MGEIMEFYTYFDGKKTDDNEKEVYLGDGKYCHLKKVEYSSSESEHFIELASKYKIEKVHEEERDWYYDESRSGTYTDPADIFDIDNNLLVVKNGEFIGVYHEQEDDTGYLKQVIIPTSGKEVLVYTGTTEREDNDVYHTVCKRLVKIEDINQGDK